MLHVRQRGRGAELVLVHGWSLNGAIWESLAERLADRFRISSVDLPGHGLSPAEHPATLERWSERLAERVPAGAILLGWSLGGQLAIALAAREPRRLARLVLVSTTPRFTVTDRWPHAMPVATLADFERRLREDYRATVDGFLALQVYGDECARATLKRLRADLHAAPWPAEQTLAEGLGLLERNDLRDRLAGIRVPTLIVSGQRDRICPPAAGRFLAARLPEARYVEIARAGHAPFLSHPQAFESALLEFLDDARAAANE